MLVLKNHENGCGVVQATGRRVDGDLIALPCTCGKSSRDNQLITCANCANFSLVAFKNRPHAGRCDVVGHEHGICDGHYLSDECLSEWRPDPTSIVDRR